MHETALVYVLLANWHSTPADWAEVLKCNAVTGVLQLHVVI